MKAPGLLTERSCILCSIASAPTYFPASEYKFHLTWIAAASRRKKALRIASSGGVGALQN